MEIACPGARPAASGAVMTGGCDAWSASGRRGPAAGGALLAVAAIALVCLCTYAPSIHLRSHYSDDFANRLAVEESNWWGACREYWGSHGLVRPLGLAAVLICQQALWDYPTAQQGVMLILCIALCLLVYLFALRVTGDRGIALAAAVILAAWPSYTSMVVWVAGGLEMLPAYATFLVALLLYLRHLGSAGGRRWWVASLTVFMVSVAFHDQHLGTAAVFTVLACLGSPAGRRTCSVLGTIPFWLAALTMGLATMLTARGTERPLEPTVTNAVIDLGVVSRSFFDMSLGEPFRHCLYGAGPRESLSRMAAADPVLLAGSALLLAAGIGMVVAALRRIRPSAPDGRSLMTLAAVGATIVLAGLGIMALQESASIKPRHTLVPAIGLAMILASAFGACRSRRARSITVMLLACLLFGLSVFRLGYTYEWTTRSRVTERLLACLDEAYPAAHRDDLLVMDGLRKYGRGFADSWGLSAAVSLRYGLPVRVTTRVRREGDRLYANDTWDKAWEIDPAAARFFVWHEDSNSLRAETCQDFLTRHPDLQFQDL